MKRILLFLFLITSFIFNAQTGFTEAYNVTLSDLETNTYKKDSTANALVIYEYGNSYVDKHEFDLIIQEKQKIKILNKEGFKHATVTVRLSKNSSIEERIENIFAFTHNLPTKKSS